ncbi:undecaprenyl/decaprenyl-phosphate alpha-N-acetylglucosaminyl 1-phosphate transferase [Mariniblastus sp.]|nr:undecaprenyl/decaprenyl-phosphate alpha-N-acetylglucosaminyl 1-phosphate transferase [Mariniblastus sp.]
MPILSVVARRVGLVDHPDDKRKLHKVSIPMVGGVALFLAATCSTLLIPQLDSVLRPVFENIDSTVASYTSSRIGSRLTRAISVRENDVYQLVGLLLGATVLMLVGLADDRFGIRGRQKLAGQFLATTVLILFGYQFDLITVAGFDIEFGIFSVFVIYAWVIASINSVNLLDGADGIAATIGIVMSVAMTVMMVYQGKILDAVVAASIAGGLLGFLKYNFPPAKAYLGDTGSMLIGFLLSALAIRCTFKQSSAYAFFAPIALLAIPFADTLAAIVRRRLTGRSIFAVDRGHLHHTLARRGYGPKVSLLWVAMFCSATAAGGTMSLIFKQSEYALVSIFIVGCVMLFFRIFGVGELQLVTRRASSAARSVMRVTPGERPDLLQSKVHVQGDRSWDAIWGQLCLFADQYSLDKITLDVNAPWLHESFHANRRRADATGERNHQWFTAIPIISEGKLFGKVEVVASPQSGFTHHQIISELMEVVALIEATLVDEKPASGDAVEASDEEAA